MSRLILFPVPIGADNGDTSLPPSNRQLLLGCSTFIVEEPRTALRFLKQQGYPLPISSDNILVLNEHTQSQSIGHYLDAIQHGDDIGLLSEAGLPCVADPGAIVVRLAQERNIEILPLVGPSSIMLALMASGFNGQQFVFHGYLPVDRHQRTSAIRQLEAAVARTSATQIFIETPYRNNQMLQSLAETCHPDTLICVACDLTQSSQSVLTRSAAFWRQHLTEYNFHKRPTVFLIGD